MDTYFQPILILGTGQIGSALARVYGQQTVQLGRGELDITDKQAVEEAIRRISPAAVINAAAYTAVDKAEREGRQEAFRVNGEAVKHIAECCARQHIPLIHYSTDYVFNGSGDAPWKESDTPAPINSYGASKLEGERYIEQAGGEYLVFRISWVYDESGSNFLNTMLKLGREREELKVVSDQFGAPCYAGDIAEATKRLLDSALHMDAFPTGIYHLCHQGITNWHGFAEAIFAEASERGERLAVRHVHAITTADYPTPAKRPLNSRLNCDKLQHDFGILLPSWQSGLKECMTRRYANYTSSTQRTGAG